MNKTIQAKVLVGIIGADKYRKLKARGKLAVGLHSRFRSQEAYAAALNRAKKSHAVRLSDEQRCLLQEVLDARCESLYESYLSSFTAAQERFIASSVSATDILSQYPVCGSAPREQAFLSEIDRLSQGLRAELQRLSAIYGTLGLRTNYPLRRVLGYNAR